MALFDWFFPEISQAENLRRLADGQRARRRAERRDGASTSSKRMDSLENDVGYVSLLLASLIQKLDEKGVLVRDDLREVMAQLDEIDGVKDGQLDINVLRGMGQ